MAKRKSDPLTITELLRLLAAGLRYTKDRRIKKVTFINENNCGGLVVVTRGGRVHTISTNDVSDYAETAADD